MSAPAQASFDTAQIGVPVTSEVIEITADDARRFAEATNDGDPEALAGRAAPPLYALVPVLKTMVAAKNAVTPAFAFHGEHDLRVHEPLQPGMSVRVTAEVVGVRQRTAGVATIVHVETRTPAGTIVNEQHFTSFVAGGRVDAPAGRDAPSHVPPPAAPGARVHELTMSLDPDQTRRFAAAADDWDAYTLDEDVARSMGFRTIIVHGTCTMAFAARAVVAAACDGESRRLERFAARMSRPLLLVPGQTLTTRIWEASAQDGRRVLGFEATDKEGTTMLKHGLAEVQA
jgi:acyl dehydratase